MKFAIALEDTPNSFDFLKKFLSEFDFYKSFSLDIIFVEEFREQEKELKDFEKKVDKILSKYDIKYNIIVETGDPVARVLNVIKKKKLKVFVCSYEHSLLGTTFFEQIMKEIEIPVIVINSNN
jgi:hypothetical protein